MTNEDIDAHFSDIKGHGSDIENRLDDSDCTVEWIKEGNRKVMYQVLLYVPECAVVFWVCRIVFRLL
jgi:hypothetical protein